MAIQLTAEQIALIDKIDNGDLLGKEDLNEILSLAKRVEAEPRSFSEADILKKGVIGINVNDIINDFEIILNKKSLSNNSFISLPIYKGEKIPGLEANKTLEDNQVKSLFAKLANAMLMANEQIANDKLIEGLEQTADSTATTKKHVASSDIEPHSGKEPKKTQVITGQGYSAIYYPPSFTGKKQLDFSQSNCEYINSITGKPIDPETQKDLKYLDEKIEQEVFNNFLTEKAYTTDADDNVLKDGKKLDSAAIKQIQDEFSNNYRTIDRLNVAANKVTDEFNSAAKKSGGTKLTYQIRFTEAPEPASRKIVEKAEENNFSKSPNCSF